MQPRLFVEGAVRLVAAHQVTSRVHDPPVEIELVGGPCNCSGWVSSPTHSRLLFRCAVSATTHKNPSYALLLYVSGPPKSSLSRMIVNGPSLWISTNITARTRPFPPADARLPEPLPK